MGEKYDFSGWATKYGVKCSDGKTIQKGAFDDLDGKEVPLVWMHDHKNIENVLGHVKLESRPEGVYAYGKFNDSPNGQYAKDNVRNKDITALSIWANQLKQERGNVYHGNIREVSLVLAGANDQALIEYPQLSHGEDLEEDALTDLIYYNSEGEDGSDLLYLDHSEKEEDSEDAKKSEEKEGEKEMPKEKTVKDVFDELTEEQKNVVYFMIGQALEDAGKGGNDNDEEDDEVKHNVFDNEEVKGVDYLSQDAMDEIFRDAKKLGSLKDSFIEHAQDYGIDGIEWLFPEDHELNNRPEYVKRETSWVTKVLNGVKHTPFSRVKTSFADITEDEARAKGYLKGNQKKTEVFTLLKRTTSPQTIYKLQKLDRDDVIDITDFDVVAWIKAEMRMMLDEEIARAILIGDGREADAEDKIKEDCVRPIATDASLFTVYKTVANPSDAANLIKAVIRARKDYKGAGNPTFFTTEDVLTEMLLLEDTTHRPLYDDINKLATKLRVKEIVTVEPMEGATVRGANLLAIMVNLQDYNVGADKGGAVNMFDDFDIDYNQQKYLIETRISGALVTPYSAVVFTATDPTTDEETHGVVRSKTTTSAGAGNTETH